MTLQHPTARFEHFSLRLEAACADPAGLCRLRGAITAAELPDDERAFLLAAAGQYEHGCKPPELTLTADGELRPALPG
jgi:hypothetical protein